MMNWKIGSINLIYFSVHKPCSHTHAHSVCQALIVCWSKTKTIFHRILHVRCRSDIKEMRLHQTVRSRIRAWGRRRDAQMHDSPDLWRKRRRSPSHCGRCWKRFRLEYSHTLVVEVEFLFRWAKIIVWNMIFSIFYNDRRCCYTEWMGPLRCQQLQKLRSHFRLHIENTCIYSINNNTFSFAFELLFGRSLFMYSANRHVHGFTPSRVPVFASVVANVTAVNKKRVICATRSKKMKWFMFSANIDVAIFCKIASPSIASGA